MNFNLLQAYQCLSSYGICMSKERVIAKLEEAGKNHDKGIMERKANIEKLGVELIACKEQIAQASERLWTRNYRESGKEVPITFINEERSVQFIKPLGASKSKTSQKTTLPCSKPLEAPEQINSVIIREFEGMAVECDQQLIQKMESLIERKREIERTMLESSYQIIGDNLDFYIKVKHMTSANQNR